MKLQIFLFLFCATSLNLICCNYLPKNHVPFFILGDSFFDPGNNNYITTLAQANYWPYGETFFKHPTGRFSDGRIIPDYVAEYAKLPFILPYLQPGNNNFTYGVNFASAGAGALSETNQGLVIDMKTQMTYFSNVDKQLRQQLGDAKVKKLFSKAVFLINFGANDYMYPFFINSPVPKSLWNDYVGMVIGNITTSIKEIYDAGGRKFAFLGLGQLGCAPIMRILVPGNSSLCHEDSNALAVLHDNALSEALHKLQSELKGFKYAKHSLSVFLDESLKDPSKYGFMELTSACCGSGRYRGQFSCGGKRGITEYELCENPNEYLFFDAGHFTEKVYGHMAELMWSGNRNVTGPYNLKELFSCK